MPNAKKKRKSDFGKYYDLKTIFGLHRILRTLESYPDFKQAIAPNVSPEKAFKGYLFLIKSVQRQLLEAIARSSSFNLEEDQTIRRAVHQGVHISSIKNSCQKTIVLKNLHRLFRTCWKSKDENALETSMRDIDNKLLKPLAEALNGEIQPSQKLKNINKDEITKFLAIFYTLIYYNDTDHGFPKGYFCSLLDNKVSEKELDEAFEGYKFAIYYLWTKLVGPRYAVLNRLVEATNWGRFDLYFQEV